jgi:predicted  nucleic acid-binding Zn-ribbon protein
MKKLLLILTFVIVLVSIGLAGCQGQGGISQQLYDDLNKAYQEVKNQVNDLSAQVTDLRTRLDNDAADIQAKDAQIADLESQIAALNGEYQLTGATVEETVAKIVKYYHETHVYSKYDLFVCSNMAAEVWNMLKAQGIASIIVVGDKDKSVSDILQANHAWVLAEVAPGQYLALETTGGFTVAASDNPLYYRGWSFDSPADLTSYNDLVKEYNIRVRLRNDINDKVNEYVDKYNASSNQAEADKYKAVFDELTALRTEQETLLNGLMGQINGLAAVLQ